MLETVFGPTLTLSSGKVIPTRWVGEQHVKEDLGFIPSFADWMRAIRPCPGWGAPAASRTGPLPKIAAQSERRAGVGGEPGGKRERLPGSPPLPLSEASPMSRICTAAPFDFRKRVSYDPKAKRLFHAHARRQLLRLAASLGFAPCAFDLRSNEGGIAVMWNAR